MSWDNAKEARWRFWAIVLFLPVLFEMGCSDLGSESIPWGGFCVFVGWKLAEACGDIGKAMEKEELG